MPVVEEFQLSSVILTLKNASSVGVSTLKCYIDIRTMPVVSEFQFSSVILTLSH